MKEKKHLKKVSLHPATIKHLNLGHFWVTEDSYTKNFPHEEIFLWGTDSERKKDIGLFLHDPLHKSVKARFFSPHLPESFLDEVGLRIEKAFLKRMELKLFLERENITLINGESDLLPGLYVLLLKNQVVIQFYALYWKKFEKELIHLLQVNVGQHLPTLTNLDFWIQERNFEQKNLTYSHQNKESIDFVVCEFGLHYLVKINARYDFGLYTDMSAIRKKIAPFLKDKKRGLNLYCYTGAFSLFMLKNGLDHVTSVDLSPKYIEWLQENYKLNESLKNKSHEEMIMSVDKALDNLIYHREKFDIIISDPPSSSSDGDKRENALRAYEDTLPKMLELLSPDGKLIVFLNTHQISFKKFEEKIKSILSNSPFKNDVITQNKFRLLEDCEAPKGMIEADYLKGLLIELKPQRKKI